MGSSLAGILKGYTTTHIADAAPHIHLCRASYSYCPVVKSWTKILEFLYCGYGTVINQSEGATSISLGRGTVGLVRLEFDTSGKFAAYEGIVSIFQGEVKQS